MRNRWHDLDFGRYSSYTAKDLYEDGEAHDFFSTAGEDWYGLYLDEPPNPLDLDERASSVYRDNCFIVKQSGDGFVGIIASYSNKREAIKDFDQLHDYHNVDGGDDETEEDE